MIVKNEGSLRNKAYQRDNLEILKGKQYPNKNARY